MAWDGNEVATEYKGKLPINALNKLRLALIERYDGANVSFPGGIAELSKNVIDIDSWLSSYQSAMSTIIVKYINHNDNSGNWDDVASIPLWSEATLLTQIGDASRLAAPAKGEFKSNWCYQQYKMLNQLRWWKGSNTVVNVERRIVTNASWSTAQTNIKVASWASYGGSQAFSYSARKSGDYVIEEIKLDFSITNTSSYSYSLDVYSNSGVFSGTHIALGNAIYKDKYNLMKSVAETTGNQTVSPLTDSDFNTTSDATPDPAPTSVYENTNKNINVMVLKYDGTNGFTFKDW